MNFSVKRNVFALYLVKVAKWMNLVMPVIVLFYKSNGMTMQDIFELQAVYSFTLMFFEIPTGFFADRLGRRTSILSGSFLGVIGYIIYSSSSGFYEFVVAEVALGIAQSLVSGADSALLYDTLLAGRLSAKYTRLEGRVSSIGNFAEAAAGILGGFLAVISLRTPFIFQAAVAAIAIPAAFSLSEPPVTASHSRIKFKDLGAIVRQTLFTNRKLRWNTIFSAVTGACTLTMAWFAQPLFIQAGLKVNWFGVIWAVLNISVGVAALYAWKIEKRLGPVWTVLIITFVLTGSYIGISLLPVTAGFGLLLIFYLVRGLATPTLRNYINCITTSDVRATVLSVRNFLIRLLFVVMGPFFGKVTDLYGLRTALLIAGGIFMVFSGISVFFFIRNRTYEPDSY